MRVRVFHWKPEESAPLLDALKGHTVYNDPVWTGSSMRLLGEHPPEVIVIDLSSRPSHGRELATAIRGRKTTRHIPIVFVDGDPVKVAAIRALLPDATFTSLSKVKTALKQALTAPPEAPVVPVQMMDRGAARTTAQKLGIRPGQRVGLINPPPDYAGVLGDLPEGAALEEEPTAVLPITIWFVRDSEDYIAKLREGRRIAARSRLWVAWPKGGRAGITQFTVREAARELGLVDYKICSVDSVWTAMAFAVKK